MYYFTFKKTAYITYNAIFCCVLKMYFSQSILPSFSAQSKITAYIY